jgi:hypothetical protein
VVKVYSVSISSPNEGTQPPPSTEGGRGLNGDVLDEESGTQPPPSTEGGRGRRTSAVKRCKGTQPPPSTEGGRGLEKMVIPSHISD